MIRRIEDVTLNMTGFDWHVPQNYEIQIMSLTTKTKFSDETMFVSSQ